MNCHSQLVNNLKSAMFWWLWDQLCVNEKILEPRKTWELCHVSFYQILCKLCFTKTGVVENYSTRRVIPLKSQATTWPNSAATWLWLESFWDLNLLDLICFMTLTWLKWSGWLEVSHLLSSKLIVTKSLYGLKGQNQVIIHVALLCLMGKITDLSNFNGCKIC